ncbi:protein tyrosine phosphatase [Cotesia vestalis bracovirus]|nr:protein tyrosine phosphatase [Cotesia vestalis bracovirus]QZB49059.1 PTP [Cotesia vestalis bracovirus]
MANYFCLWKLTPSDFIKKIKQPNFNEYVSREFQQLNTVPLEGTFNEFSKDENVTKNRYYDVQCWDHSRVILTSQGNKVYDHSQSGSYSIVVTKKDSDSTYIHANFVDGFEDEKKFICAQGPKTNTVGDFWKLVWEKDVRMIVSLTQIDCEDGVCYEYWVAEEGYELLFGRYAVKTLMIKEEPGYITTLLSIFDVTYGESRLVTHYCYTAWPSYGAPANLKEFLAFMSTVHQEREWSLERARLQFASQPGPILVHCSAGVGRTGTFCAIDHALNCLKKTKAVSVQESVLAIRKMRHLSVVTLEQYKFIYKVIEHVLLGEESNKIYLKI